MKTKIESPIQENIHRMSSMLCQLGLAKKEDEELINFTLNLEFSNVFVHLFTTMDIKNISSNMNIILSNEKATKILKQIELEYDCQIGLNISIIENFIRKNTTNYKWVESC